MRFQCSECNGIVDVDNNRLGQKVQCGHCDSAVRVPGSRLSPGAIVADFIIIQEIGRGGMGVVYEAHQISLDRPAALKILEEEAQDPEFVANFIKEARAAAKLNHPHIVQAYAVGEDNGIYYFAMEFIDGLTMKDIIKRDKIISPEDAASVIQQVAEALDYAWKEEKLIHRDIKPDNIMITKNNRAKLADLGLSQVAGETVENDEEEEIMGTPQYISPEHLTGQPMDVRSDIYSLGATFYQMVTGTFPYLAGTPNETARMHLEEQLTPPKERNDKIPDEMNDIIVKMMEKNPRDRYQDAHELVNELNRLRRFMKGHSLKLNKEKKSKLSLKNLKKKKGAKATPKGVKPATIRTTVPDGQKVEAPAAPALKMSSDTKKPELKASGSKTINAPSAAPKIGGLTTTKPSSEAIKAPNIQPPKAPGIQPPTPSGTKPPTGIVPPAAPTPPSGTTPPDMAATLVMPKKEEKEEKKEEGGGLQVSQQTEQKEGAGLVAIERTFKPKKESKLGKMITWLVVLIVIGGGGAAAWFFWLDQKVSNIPYYDKLFKSDTDTSTAAGGKETKPETKGPDEVKPPQPKPPKPKPPKPVKSQYCKDIELILKDYQDFNNKQSFLRKADRFLEENPQPESIADNQTLILLMEQYVPLDEERIQSERERLHKEYEKRLAAQGVTKDVDPEAAAKRIEAEIEKQRKEAEKARLAKIEAEKIRIRTAEYKKKLANDAADLQANFIDCLLTFKYDELKKLIKEAQGETARAAKLSQGERKLAAEYVKRPQEYEKLFNNFMKLYNALLNNGTKLAGRQIELPPRKLLAIVKVEDRNIQLKDLATDKVITIPVSDLKGRYYRGYAKKALKDFSVPDQNFCALIVNGDIGPEIISETPKGYWSRELPQAKYQYIRKKYREADEAGREKMKQSYGNWKVFTKAIQGIK